MQYFNDSSKNPTSPYLVKNERFIFFFRESSFNMTRGADDDIAGGSCENFQTPERGALKKVGGLRKFVYLKTNRSGTPKKLNR